MSKDQRIADLLELVRAGLWRLEAASLLHQAPSTRAEAVKLLHQVELWTDELERLFAARAAVPAASSQSESRTQADRIVQSAEVTASGSETPRLQACAESPGLQDWREADC